MLPSFCDRDRAVHDPEGRIPFERWFNRLEPGIRTRVTVALDRLRSGNITAKSLGRGVMEMRLDFGPGYRIYLGRDGDALVILLSGGSKKRQPDDIAVAQLLWQQYKQSKDKR